MRKNPNMPDMARPKEPNREERIAVQVPASWMKLARKLAADAKQPVLWFIIGLIAEKADSEDIAHPPLPWESEE